MGIKIAYAFAVLYAILSGIGLLNFGLGVPYTYLFIFLVAAYLISYITFKKIDLLYTMAVAALVNAAVQLSGGLNSPLVLMYYVALPVMGYRDTERNYWIVALTVLLIELSSSLITRRFQVLPFGFLIAAVVVVGYIIANMRDRESSVTRSLAKYETRDQFFAPAAFAPDKVMTSVGEIDRHKGIERPLLYYVKFVHNVFNAHTTAIFACNEDKMVLVQGFSHSDSSCRTASSKPAQDSIIRQLASGGRS
jgi:hypothetical protein